MWLGWVSLLGVVAACHSEEPVDAPFPRRDGGGRSRPGVDLTGLCSGKSVCADFGSDRVFYGDVIRLDDCAVNGAALLNGFWWVEDAGSRPFEWEAEVRVGGVFPTRGHMATNLYCDKAHGQAHTPDVGLAFDPPDFAWARLEDDDVFIPLGGKAEIDHELHASAVLEGPNAASTGHVRVTVVGRDGYPAVWYGLERGDDFQWGRHRATVVRIVAPQAGVLGAIGWVEIELADVEGNPHWFGAWGEQPVR